MDLPQSIVIAESSHRIHNPVDSRKLAELGEALRLTPGSTVLDLASGSGEMLCTWARDHGIGGTGVDISTAFVANAKSRAAELGVADRVGFVHGDAAGHVASEPVDVAACIGATWIGGGTAGTVELLQRSLRPGGLMLIGECYWRLDPPDDATIEGCYAESKDSFRSLPGLFDHFDSLGYDVVEMVLADQDSWDRYAAPHWLNIRRWLDANPGHEMADEMRHQLDVERRNHVRYQRDYLGWGMFALMRR
ncbi:class I SAM-dependent methyltransferase [Glycomyces sp. TRM65418]|uniref:SAM-dependent methyltransferase n=1 Tax=Glycomyces sp. TRM65418 TaxID=2867006 RepID=UPI001CE4D353|nr:methyltransferase domain-containing protein [Glycomyces sp. TRM65418]MCC3765079.1 class I SAM-dependent methyltransferase [Glycomyces sp. TRM65418]QZD54708.1 class I SAM-dependent methyltransferase [Glycomyces sp. TRM65418]